MPYIGHSPTQAGSFIEIDDYGSSFNGSTTAFTLQVGGVDVTPNAQNLLVMIDGVVQMPTSAYSVSGSTITYTEAPPSGADSYVVLMGQSASVGQGTVGADELKVSGNGSNGQVLVSDGDGTFSWTTDSEPYLPLAGGTMSGAINLGSQNITNGGTITGTFVGNITGNVTGNTSGTAATVTGASQSNITSVGTLTSLTLGGDLLVPQYIKHVGDTDCHIEFGTDEVKLRTGDSSRLIARNSDVELYSPLIATSATFSGLTHLKGSNWNSILRLGDTSRSEQLTHINNGSVSFSIYTSNGTKGVITANHDGSAMTLGADYGSGTLTVYAPTTFSGNVTINKSNALFNLQEPSGSQAYLFSGGSFTAFRTTSNHPIHISANYSSSDKTTFGTDGSLRTTGVFYGNDNGASSPGFRFYNAASGMYHAGSDNIGFAVSGNNVATLTASSATFAGDITVRDTGSSSSIEVDGTTGSGNDGQVFVKGHTSSNSRAFIYFNNGHSSGGQNWYLGALRGSNAFALSTIDDSNGGTNVFTVDGNKKIGIGTDPTTSKLTIFQDSGVYAQYIQQNQGDGNCLDLYASSSDEHSNDPILRCRTDASNRFIVFNNGGVEVNNSLVHSGSSDERVKKNISTMTNVISDIEKLRGVTFKWRAEVKDLKWSHHNHSKTEYGMIAQEMETVFPELVTEDDRGVKNIRYEPVISILLQGIKELNERIKVLESA